MFDPSKTLDENLSAFRTACNQIDPECTNILFENLDILRESGSERAARQTFNSSVKRALDQLPDVQAVVQ